jgi:16S rRNA (guanine527-N7)-methyltransferase
MTLPRADAASEENHGGSIVECLIEARRRGFLGPGPVEPHVFHARAFARAVIDALGSAPHRLADLGSGGGVPGLVIAWRLPAAEVVLIESGVRRAELLRTSVGACELDKRVEVQAIRAEVAGRDSTFRSSFDAVVARSFGPPAVTAECAAPLLRVDGVLVVSEPPSSQLTERWPAEHLRSLGLEIEALVEEPAHLIVLRQRELCGDRFPRRVGVPGKRPLF